MIVHDWIAQWSAWGWPFLANHLWQATLLSLLAFAAAALLRKGPGRARYAIWLIASAKFVLPSAVFVIIARQLGLDFSSMFISNSEIGQGAGIVSQLTTPLMQWEESAVASETIVRGHNELFCALTLIWFTGCLAFLAVWWRHRARFRGAIHASRITARTRERETLDRVRAWLKIERKVRLFISQQTIEPGVWGVFRPVVLLPERMAEELDDAELEAVMMHEMIHVARRDNLIANVQRLLCCLLWFHPVVWLLDRLLLVDRERACDEEVMRLGGASEVYASSLLKVLRFCLGWNVAGASNAAGSNLGRRIERIMSTNADLKLSIWHRLAITSIAVLVIALSIAAGFLSGEGVVAQNRKPVEGIAGGVVGGVRGGVAGGVPGGIPGGIPGGVADGIGFAITDEQGNLIERLDKATEVAIEFKNSGKAPLAITDARAKSVLRTQDASGDEYAVIPLVTVVNNGDRRVKFFTLEFRNGLERRAYSERATMEPHTMYRSGGQKRFIILTGGAEAWSVRVAGVLFDDGDVWGMVPPPPPPPPPPAEMLKLEQAPENALPFQNTDGAPVSITGLAGKAVLLDRQERERLNPAAPWGYLMRLSLQVVNNTDKRVVGLGIACRTPEQANLTNIPVILAPHSSNKLVVPHSDGGFILVHGNFERLDIAIVGVKFEDGETWGKFVEPPAAPVFTQAPPPPPPPPQEASASDSSKIIRKSGGGLIGSVVRRVEPDFPPLAKAAQISGAVVVEVTVDESGNVIAARAISGHPLLKDAAVTAARQWQFAPTTVEDKPVKVVGTVTFNFQL
ncbi:MAG TPA: M56 family metallopeptidase [Blastocatellia bacterium]